ncbi:MAG: HNH endonuclease, partial [Nocardiopsaceae bacterium]|nr:HNH endonuclease [Nocardiopsaceae bacterium]
TGSLDALRARVYTTLLLGQPIAALRAQLLADAARQGPAGPDGTRGAPGTPAGARPEAGGAADAAREQRPGCYPPGSPGLDWPVTTGLGPLGRPSALGAHPVPGIPGPGWPGPGGSVNLTMPLATWLGGSGAPGEAAGFGPIPATDAQALAALAGARPGSRWCITLTGQDGGALAHGCARIHPGGTSPGSSRPGDAGRVPGWVLTVSIRALAYQTCSHERESSSYRPSPGLGHLITVRQRRCSFPGCRHPAIRCDQEHTVPFGNGGRTCECNLAPLCRRHHRAKQAQGWHLDQPEPGVMSWTLPHGRRYRTGPQPYPGDGRGP